MYRLERDLKKEGEEGKPAWADDTPTEDERSVRETSLWEMQSKGYVHRWRAKKGDFRPVISRRGCQKDKQGLGRPVWASNCPFRGPCAARQLRSRRAKTERGEYFKYLPSVRAKGKSRSTTKGQEVSKGSSQPRKFSTLFPSKKVV